jgi:1-acyl-sn-glycerol-3-phosphate acyltransferase
VAIASHIRAALRLPFLAGAVLFFGTAGAAAQAAIIGPVFKNYTFMPWLTAQAMRRIVGIRIVFNRTAAPLETKRPVFYVANHMSELDLPTLGSVLPARFVGAAWLGKMPVVGWFCKACKVLLVKRHNSYNPENRGQIAAAFNRGDNVAMFPEATTNDGAVVYEFKKGLFGQFYAEDSAVLLQKKVFVQPLAMRVLTVGGKDALNDTQLRQAYTLHDKDKSWLRKMWNTLGTSGMVVELTPFAPLDPRDFKDAAALAQAAEKLVVSHVVPHQKGTIKPPKFDLSWGEQGKSGP